MSPYRSPASPSSRPLRIIRGARLPWWVDYALDRFRWYRRWRGGHWERWFIDFPVCAEIWLQNEHGTRPGLGCGTPVCEDYQ